MDNRLKAINLELKKMASSHAADWLIQNYPTADAEYGEVFQLIPHVSWRRVDQIRLAKYYLQKMPFASSRVYDVFASFMSFELFVKIIRDQLPISKNDRDLLLYHLHPVLEKCAKTDSDRALMRSFVAELV